jgi:hypothetical protein
MGVSIQETGDEGQETGSWLFVIRYSLFVIRGVPEFVVGCVVVKLYVDLRSANGAAPLPDGGRKIRLL